MKRNDLSPAMQRALATLTPEWKRTYVHFNTLAALESRGLIEVRLGSWGIAGPWEARRADLIGPPNVVRGSRHSTESTREAKTADRGESVHAENTPARCELSGAPSASTVVDLSGGDEVEAEG
jgi:hypothetical protein